MAAQMTAAKKRRNGRKKLFDFRLFDFREFAAFLRRNAPEWLEAHDRGSRDQRNPNSPEST